MGEGFKKLEWMCLDQALYLCGIYLNPNECDMKNPHIAHEIIVHPIWGISKFFFFT